MNRTFSVIRRRANLIDLTTPRVYGVDSYRLKWSDNFDGSFTTFLTVSNTGYLDSNVNPYSVDAQPGSAVRMVFDPATFSIPDTAHIWLQLWHVIGGVETQQSACTLILPEAAHKGVGLLTLHGTAPSGADVSSSLQIDLPRLMTDFRFNNEEGAVDLFVAFEDGGPEMRVAHGKEPFSSYLATQGSVFVRGGGATAAFSLSCTAAFPKLASCFLKIGTISFGALLCDLALFFYDLVQAKAHSSLGRGSSMLRLIHSQATPGPIRVDDIDDGLPNKTAHHAAADPKAYARDGYANAPKQPSYVPYSKASDTSIAGYIDLQETDRVTYSAGKGKISKLVTAGHISVVSFVAADLATPVVTGAVTDTPGAGDLTITGTKFLSIAPNTSSVIITGTGAITLTLAQILVGLGTFTETSIVIPAALIPGVDSTVSSVKVRADDHNSNTFVVTA